MKRNDLINLFTIEKEDDNIYNIEKLRIADRASKGDCFIVIDDNGEIVDMANELNLDYACIDLDDGKKELIFNPDNECNQFLIGKGKELGSWYIKKEFENEYNERVKLEKGHSIEKQAKVAEKMCKEGKGVSFLNKTIDKSNPNLLLNETLKYTCNNDYFNVTVTINI